MNVEALYYINDKPVLIQLIWLSANQGPILLTWFNFIPNMDK